MAARRKKARHKPFTFAEYWPIVREVLLTSVTIHNAAVVPAALAFGVQWSLTARQHFAEHFFGSSALHCTATARILIPAECSAVS